MNDRFYEIGLIILMIIVYVPMLVNFSKSYWKILENLYEKHIEGNHDESNRGSGG